MRNTITLALVAAAGVALSAQTPQSTSSPSAAQNSTTVTGCLEAGPNNTFTLTSVAPAGTKGTTLRTTTAGAHIETVTYTLTPAPGTDLKSNAGKKVQVTGTATPPEASASETSRSSATETAKGTSGRTPVVQTTERARIVARQLSVSSIKAVASSCDILK